MVTAEARGGIGVRVRAVSHAFGGTMAIERVDLEVAPGGFVAIVGDSGGGKTTLLRLMGGLLAPTSGTVEFTDARGDPVRPGDGDVSFCFQEGRLLPWRSVLENVALPLELEGVAAGPRRERAAQMLERMRLADASGRMPGQLSGGMRMRVAMARALITRPRLLLLDEPFGALDEVTRLALDEELREIWRSSGATAVLVTHSIQEAVALAQSVVVMQGRPGRSCSAIPIRLPAKENVRATMEFVSLCDEVHRRMTGRAVESAGGMR